MLKVYGKSRCAKVAVPESRVPSPAKLRRDCLDCVIILGERHLGAILKSYLDYYHWSRTRLALGKDAPEPRLVQQSELGVWWNCLRLAVSIIDTAESGIATPSCSADHSLYASWLLPLRRFGRRTNRSAVPPRRSHQRTSFSRSSPKGHQAGEFHQREVLANHRHRVSSASSSIWTP